MHHKVPLYPEKLARFLAGTKPAVENKHKTKRLEGGQNPYVERVESHHQAFYELSL